MDSKQILDWLKLKPRYLLGFSLVCLLIAGLPRSVRLYLGFENIVAPIQGLLSLLGIAAGVYGFVILAADHWPKARKWWALRKLRENAPTILRSLSPDEKGCLARYVANEATSLNFSFTDGVVSSLESKRILYQASSLSVQFDDFAYNLQPWVVRALKDDQELREELLRYVERGPVPRAPLFP